MSNAVNHGLEKTDKMAGYYFEDLSTGMSESYSRVVTSADIENFAALSGDNNPIHLDEEFAATTLFGGRVAHGFLSASFISTVIGTKLPGPGAIYMSQSLRFLAPVRIDDTVTAQVIVASLNKEKNRAILTCTCNVNGEPVIEGEAMVKVPSRAL